MLLGLDLGTSSIKALLLAEDGSVLGEGSASYAVRAPRPGWAEARSCGELAAYRELAGDLDRRLANPPAVGMAGPSLLWLRDQEPEAYTSARWALQPKDWLRMRLTGEATTEPSDASATLLYDLIDDDWSYAAAGELGIRANLLAPLVPSATVAGTIERGAAGALGLREGLPVAAGAADTAAALLGTGLLRPGPVQLTVGTGGQVVTPKER